MISDAARGRMKFAVPTWTARAPTIKNSRASAAVRIPPRPITGNGNRLNRLVDQPQGHRFDGRSR